MLRRLSHLVLSALLAGAGVLHFASPKPFAAIVPPALPNPELLVYLSGLAELVVAVGLLPRRTRRLAGWAAIALFVAVFPANVYAALHGGYPSLRPPLNSEVAGWLRLPLQAVLIWWAWRISKSA